MDVRAFHHDKPVDSNSNCFNDNTPSNVNLVHNGNDQDGAINYSESDSENAIENEDTETHCPRPHRQFMPTLDNAEVAFRVVHAESDNSDTEDEQDAEDVQQERILKPSTKAQSVTLPIPPVFAPINQSGHHEAHLQGLPEFVQSELSFFRLYFTDDILDTIVNNTNTYAHDARVKQP
ncbi:hypothetical protein BGX34_008126, partial [Mortierella sp. NVP85]